MTLVWESLRVSFSGRAVVDLQHIELRDGELLGMAGESGSGKSMTALATIGLAQRLGAEVTGSITLDGDQLVGKSEAQLRAVRGRRIAMIFQSPAATFNPTFRVGDVFVRALRLHGASRSEAHERARGAMRQVALSADLLNRYPHTLSGGQAQRTAIALAVALRAEVLLADEPTSALDVTVQAEVLETLRRAREQDNLSVLFISHDLAVISQLCDRVVVMQNGAIVEEGSVRAVLRSPAAPYTRELLAAVPRLGRHKEAANHA